MHAGPGSHAHTAASTQHTPQEADGYTGARESKNSKAASKCIRADMATDGGEEIHICYDSNGKRQERQRQTRGMQNECDERKCTWFLWGRANGSKRARCEVYSMRRPVDLKKTSSNKQEHDGQAYA